MYVKVHNMAHAGMPVMHLQRYGDSTPQHRVRDIWVSHWIKEKVKEFAAKEVRNWLSKNESLSDIAKVQPHGHFDPWTNKQLD